MCARHISAGPIRGLASALLRLCTNLSSVCSRRPARARQMSFLLTCPNCGEREVTDFAYGGEVVPRPTTKPSERELNAYNYFRRNVAGRAAGVVVSPLGLPGVVPRRARHDHQRGPVGRPARSDEPPPPQPRRADRPRIEAVSFSFDGKPVEAFEGDTIGSALHAAGQQVLSRSFKYHRPRGLFCCAGQCPNCLVEVDGWPGRPRLHGAGPGGDEGRRT